MPTLSDRFEARRQKASGEAPPSASPETFVAYNDLFADLAERVSHLTGYRSRSDRARMVSQLKEIDGLVHAMLSHLGDRPG